MIGKLRLNLFLLAVVGTDKFPRVGDGAPRYIWYLGDAVADGGGAPGGLRLIEIPDIWRLGDLKSSTKGSTSAIPLSKELK